MRFSRAALVAGRRLVPILLQLAREHPFATRGIERMMPASPMGAAVDPYLRADNVDAVMIYPAEKGGWHADFILKHVPIGINRIIGTPIATPASTRQAAQDWAVAGLAMMINTPKTKTDPPSPPVFDYYGFYFNLIPGAMEAAAQAIPDTDADRPYVLDRLKSITEQLFNGNPTEEQFDSISEDAGRTLYAVFHRAALAGITRYPPSEPAPPDGIGPGPFLVN